MNRLNDPFEPTPEVFHLRVEQTLGELRRSTSPKRYARRLVFASVAAAALLLGTAFAQGNLGVLHFFTQRYEQPIEAQTIVQPTSQCCDSKLLNAALQDAYWNGETLVISLNVHPKDANTALYTETDVGADGEHFDKIWWKGEILSFDTWRDGRKTIELQLPHVAADVPCRLQSWDWVQDEQGETLLIELHAENMTQGAMLTVTLESRVLDTDEMEMAILTATLPDMTKGEVQE